MSEKKHEASLVSMDLKFTGMNVQKNGPEEEKLHCLMSLELWLRSRCESHEIQKIMVSMNHLYPRKFQ